MRLRSMVRPGEPMGPAELTRLVNQYIERNHPENGRQHLLGPKDLGRLERQGVRWPHEVRREALRSVLGVDSDADLGFMPPRRHSADEVTALSSAVADAASQAGARPAGPRHAPASADSLPTTKLPTVVGLEDISQLRDTADQFRLWDASHGGGVLRQAALDRVHFAARMLKEVACHDRYRKDFYAAVGRLAQAAAFMSFDGKNYTDATKLFVFGKDCAEEAGDWSLRASIYSSMARQAFWQGDPEEGRTCIEFAMVRLDRLTPTEQAMVHAVHARALAKFGRVREALTAVCKADEAFAAATADVGYAAYFDAAERDGETGHALSDLAVRGSYGAEAEQRLTNAIALHGPEYTRSRTFCRIQLAIQKMVTGDPYEASALGIQATEDAASIRSTRIDDTLLNLHRLAGRRVRIPVVAELRDRIEELVST
jgi:hypothetical protein